MEAEAATQVRSRHNPQLTGDQFRRLSDLKWSRRCTWPEFYQWALPHLEKAHADEVSQGTTFRWS